MPEGVLKKVVKSKEEKARDLEEVCSCTNFGYVIDFLLPFDFEINLIAVLCQVN